MFKDDLREMVSCFERQISIV